MQVLKPALVGAKATIASEIKSGISHLYQTNDGNLYAVLRPEGQQLVAVAVAGGKLKQSRHHLINFAIANNFKSIRFHTKHPERLIKGLAGLPLNLIEVRQSLLGRDELIYTLELN